MLVSAFPKLKDKKFVHLLCAFFRSPYYCALIAALMAVSELFALELPVYYIYLVIGTVCLLFAEDTVGIMPIACCGYMTFAAQNNPGRYPETSAFLQPKTYVQLGFILLLGVILFLGRLIVSMGELPKKRVPKLSLGFLLLGVAYLIGGAFSGFYAFDTVLYGFVQIVSLCVFYFFFYYTVDWRTVKASYFAVMFTATGFGMLAEIIGMYFLPGVFVNGQLNRGALYTGWGVYNNVGCIMAMCMPAPFYFAATRKNGWIYSIIGCVFFLAVVLTQSRGSVLSAIALFMICIVAVLIRAKKYEKLWNAIVIGAFVSAVAIALAIKRDAVDIFFFSLFKSGMDSSGRIGIYKKCWETFRAHPIFGVGFYKTPGAVLADGSMMGETPAGSFIPARAHNTYFQLLASGGVIALLAYLYHRAENLQAFFRHPTAEKTFAFFCICGLIFTSLLDCNFFNIGPGILYSLLLACAECTDPRNQLYREKGRGNAQQAEQVEQTEETQQTEQAEQSEHEEAEQAEQAQQSEHEEA